jgi:uroporphyrinogen III methyltransferase/synthase
MKSEMLAAGIRALGARVLILPVISIKGIADITALDAALDALQRYSWIIFSSAYGVRYFLCRMRERGIDGFSHETPQICAVGPGTAAALEAKKIAVALVPKVFVAEGILTALAERYGSLRHLAGLHILLPRAKDARDLLPRTLEEAGAYVDVVPCYQSCQPEIDADLVQEILLNPPELLVFTSSATVINLVSALGGEAGRRLLSGARVAVLGPITAGTVAAFGKQAEIVPAENTIVSLIDAIRVSYQTSGFQARTPGPT